MSHTIRQYLLFLFYQTLQQLPKLLLCVSLPYPIIKIVTV
jgi:hypothetical protein